MILLSVTPEKYGDQGGVQVHATAFVARHESVLPFLRSAAALEGPPAGYSQRDCSRAGMKDPRLGAVSVPRPPPPSNVPGYRQRLLELSLDQDSYQLLELPSDALGQQVGAKCFRGIRTNGGTIGRGRIPPTLLKRPPPDH